MKYICYAHRFCKNSPACPFGQPHEYCDNDMTTSRCYDIDPYITGGALVWSEPMEHESFAYKLQNISGIHPATEEKDKIYYASGGYIKKVHIKGRIFWNAQHENGTSGMFALLRDARKFLDAKKQSTKEKES